MEPADSNALLQRFVESHSDEAFAELVARHVNLVYSVALRQVGQPGDAQEITQAVFIILAKKAGQLRHEKALSSWLFQTTRLTANNFIRSEMRRHRREQEAFMPSVFNEPEDAVWRQIAPALDDAVTALGEKDRRAIILRFYEGRNLREVGAGLGSSEDAAEKRVSRALEKLRNFFFKRGIHSTPSALAGAISAYSVQVAPTGLAKTISAVALAKSAATSASTLTLVKGALKLMAWTNAKTVIVATTTLVLATSTTTVVVKEIISSNRQALYEVIFQHPDSSSLARLQKAPPVLIVRPTRYPGLAGGVWTSNSKGVFVGAPISDLLCWAYGVLPTRMVLPADAPGGKYDYLDTLRNGHQEALRAKIKKQFGLVAHTETQDTDVLLLKIKDDALLKPHRSGGGDARSYINGENQTETYHLENEKLSDVALDLEPYFEKPIIDGAGSAARYTFQLQWPDSLTGMEDVAQTVQQQLGQLGLELAPTNMPIKVLVVEKAK